MPTSPLLRCLAFHSIKTAPGVGPLVAKIKSWISTAPVSPDFPTTMAGVADSCWKF